MEPTFKAALDTFVSQAQAIVDAHMASFVNLPREVLTVEPGRRYVRVVRSNGGSSRSVYCFIDSTNGNVLKAESWKKPHPMMRGNVYRDPANKCVDWHGAFYAR